MIGKLLLSTVIIASASFGAIMTSQAVTTYTTENGLSVVLKADSSWEYQTPGKQAIENDIFEQLGDGRILNIRADGTYGFLQKNEHTAILMSGVKSIEVSAVSENTDHNAAVIAVTKEIMGKAAARINTTVFKGAENPQRIIDCIKESAKDVTPVEQFIEAQKKWKVTVEIKMFREQVIQIAECVVAKKKAAKAEADSLKALKSGKAKKGSSIAQ